MKLNIGDKVVWVEFDNKQKRTKGKVTNVIIGDKIVIHWDNGRTINYSFEQISNMEQGHYSGLMILDVESIRHDKLESIGI